MTNGEPTLKDKIELMAQNLSSELHNELYPHKLRERLMAQSTEIRLTILAKYEGMGIILQKLGANIDNINKLEAMIEEEGNKTVEGRY